MTIGEKAMPQLALRHINLPIYQLPTQADGFRIAHISDLHLRRWNRLLETLRQTLRDQQYDILLVTGDIADSPQQCETAARLACRLLEPVRPPLGIYGILGNHDHPALAHQETPITLLRNTNRLISVGRFEFYLAGVEQSATRRGSVHEATCDLPGDAHQVVLTHYPSSIYELPPARGSVVLAGHTHGGQIRLPLLGCLWTNDLIPAALARGLHNVRGNWLHVTAGIGVSWPIRQRFLCPPEVTLITLRTPVRVRNRQIRVKRHRTTDRVRV
jgi:predicted MPP superfamily phosphohydrolase